MCRIETNPGVIYDLFINAKDVPQNLPFTNYNAFNRDTKCGIEVLTSTRFYESSLKLEFPIFRECREDGTVEVTAAEVAGPASTSRCPLTS